MNQLKLQAHDGVIIAEVEITPNDTTSMIDAVAKYIEEDIKQILYPENMPKSNGVLEVLKSNLNTFQKHLGAWENTVITESKMDKWIKGGFSRVDIGTPEYWKARGFEGDLSEHEELLTKYTRTIDLVKDVNKALHVAGLLQPGLIFGSYCYTLKSKKDA